jgi:subtilisin family serine protease
MPIKVLDENSNGLLDDVVAGFYFAVDNGAQIINTSFGTVTPSLILEEAVNYATLNNVTIICSAGNGASSAPHYPSSYLDCISVSAIKYDQTLAFYSNYGTDIDLCAPGGSLAFDQNLDGKPDGIVQQTHNGIDFQTFDFYIFQGTSCAAAHVTGVAALMVAASGGSIGPDLVKSTLASTAVDLGTAGWDQYFGSGLVDAAAALTSLPIIATAASASPLQPFIPVSPVPHPGSGLWGGANIAPVFTPEAVWNAQRTYPQNRAIWAWPEVMKPFFPFTTQIPFHNYSSLWFSPGISLGRQAPFSFPINPVFSGINPIQGYSAYPPFPALWRNLF